MLDYDLTGLERGSQSQSRMTERSLLKSFHSLAIFSALFSLHCDFSSLNDEYACQVYSRPIVGRSATASSR